MLASFWLQFTNVFMSVGKDQWNKTQQSPFKLLSGCHQLHRGRCCSSFLLLYIYLVIKMCCFFFSCFFNSFLLLLYSFAFIIFSPIFFLLFLHVPKIVSFFPLFLLVPPSWCQSSHYSGKFWELQVLSASGCCSHWSLWLPREIISSWFIVTLTPAADVCLLCSVFQLLLILLVSPETPWSERFFLDSPEKNRVKYVCWWTQRRLWDLRWPSWRQFRWFGLKGGFGGKIIWWLSTLKPLCFKAVFPFHYFIYYYLLY